MTLYAEVYEDGEMGWEADIQTNSSTRDDVRPMQPNLVCAAIAGLKGYVAEGLVTDQQIAAEMAKLQRQLPDNTVRDIPLPA